MNTTEDGLIRSIAAEPEDDTPRLVYSDWLEEHGQPERAEFIRAQIALARDPVDSPRRRALAFRARQLLDAHEADWLGALRQQAIEWTFRRGFVEGLLLDVGHLAAFAENQGFDRLPLRRLALIGIDDPGLSQLRAIPKENQLLELDLTGNGLPNESVRALVALKCWPRLRRLSLQFNRLDSGIGEVFNASPLFRGLERIQLGGNPLNPEEGALLLGNYLGGPIRFEVERHPDHLYAFAGEFNDGCCKPGTVSERRQVLLGGSLGELHVALFDFEGNLLGIERRPETTDDPLRETEEWLAEFAFVPGPIRVKRFRFSSDEGIADFAFEEEFHQNDRGLEFHVALAPTWLRDGRFRYDYWGGDFWLDRTGEVVAT
jgi:uncharacterized protein (TIGR02996 family)